jgi:hypothetical protein
VIGSRTVLNSRSHPDGNEWRPDENAFNFSEEPDTRWHTRVLAMTTPDAHHVQTLPRRPYVTTRTLEVFALALRLAERLGHEDVTEIHIVLGMLQEGRGMGVAVLHSRGVSLDARSELVRLRGVRPGA